jgi:hypothetical protein
MPIKKTLFIPYLEDLLGEVEAQVIDESIAKNSLYLTLETDLVQIGEISPDEFSNSIKALNNIPREDLIAHGIDVFEVVRKDPRMGVVTVRMTENRKKASLVKTSSSVEDIQKSLDQAGVNTKSFDSPLLILREVQKSLKAFALELSAKDVKDFELACFDSKANVFKNYYTHIFNLGNVYVLTLKYFQKKIDTYDAVVMVNPKNGVRMSSIPKLANTYLKFSNQDRNLIINMLVQLQKIDPNITEASLSHVPTIILDKFMGMLQGFKQVPPPLGGSKFTVNSNGNTFTFSVSDLEPVRGALKGDNVTAPSKASVQIVLKNFIPQIVFEISDHLNLTQDQVLSAFKKMGYGKIAVYLFSKITNLSLISQPLTTTLKSLVDINTHK